MTHHITGTTHPTTIQLGGNYSVQIFGVHLNTGEATGTALYAYIIDGGGQMDLVSLEPAAITPVDGDVVTVDDFVREARQVIKRYSGLGRLLDAIENGENS